MYFDGGYEFDPIAKVDTWQMGVGKLQWLDKSNTLEVHLRRPGLLIGKAGRTIYAFEKWVGYKVKIVEINLLK